MINLNVYFVTPLNGYLLGGANQLSKNNRLKLIRVLIDAGYKSIEYKTFNSKPLNAVETALENRLGDELDLLKKLKSVKAYLRKQSLRGSGQEMCEEHLFRSILTHRHGIILHEGSSQWKDKTVNEYLSSLESFFKRHPEHLTDQLKDNLAKLETFKVDLDEKMADQLAKKFANGELIVVRGYWNHDHYVTLVLKGKDLWICNRGGYRLEGLPPGIARYRLKRPEELTGKTLLDLSRKPLFTSFNATVLGVQHDGFLVHKMSEQPGGFCAWQNKKSALILLYALSFKYENDTELKALLAKGQTIYKQWSREDKALFLDKLVARYSSKKMRPDKGLLLYLYLRLKSKADKEKMFTLLTKHKLLTRHFTKNLDNGKNLIEVCTSITDLETLIKLAGKNWLEALKILAKEKDLIAFHKKAGRNEIADMLANEIEKLEDSDSSDWDLDSD